MEATPHSCIMRNCRFNTCRVLGRYWSIHVVQSIELRSVSRNLWHHTSFQILIQYFIWSQKNSSVMITRVWLHLVSHGAPSLRRQTAARDRFTTDQQCFYANVPEWVQYPQVIIESFNLLPGQQYLYIVKINWIAKPVPLQRESLLCKSVFLITPCFFPPPTPFCFPCFIFTDEFQMCFSLVCSLWILKRSANAKLMGNVNSSLGNFLKFPSVFLRALGSAIKGV